MKLTHSFSGRKFHIVELFLLTLVFIGTIHAQTNGVDTSFNAYPEKDATSTPHFILQPDDKYIIFGQFQLVDGTPNNGVARINTDGTLDSTFHCSICDFSVTSVVSLPDGKVVVAGSAGDVTQQSRIYRLNSDGSLDPSFNSPFSSSGENTVNVRAVQSDGKILVVHYIRAGSAYGYTLYRLNIDGSIDATFTTISVGGGVGGNSGQLPGKIAMTPEGKILVATNSFVNFGSGTAELKRYNTDGTTDSAFSAPTATTTGFSGVYINDFDILSDGSVIIVGQFSTVNGIDRSNYAKVLPAGNVDLSFNNTNYGSITGVEALTDDKIIISPEISSAPFYRLNTDGSLDNSFTSPTDLGTIIDWTLDSTQKVVFNTAANFGRLDDDGSLLSTFTVNFGTAGSITAITVQADGKVLLAGDFVRVNGAERARIARVNNDGSLDAAFDPGTGPDSTQINKMVVQPDGKILVVGNFTAFAGTVHNSIVRLNADGSLDATFAPAVDPPAVRTVALQSDGKILIGGSFTSVNGAAHPGLARLNSDSSLDTAFDPIFGSPLILGIAVQTDGKIIVGGIFNGVNGFNRKNIVRLNADGTLDTSFDNLNSSILASGVRQVELLADGKILALTAGTIARLENNGATDGSFTSPTITGDLIYQLTVQPDGSIIFVGSFTKINNITSLNIARLEPNGNFTPLFQGSNAVIRTIVSQPDGLVIVGGDFSRIWNVDRIGIARLSIDSASGKTAFDFDGDGRADVAVFRPSGGDWYQILSGNGTFHAFHFGLEIDRIVPADYDGDGKADVAVFRDTVQGAEGFAYFYITKSSNNSFVPVQFGSTGDLPVTGDWDGDGLADFAVYRDGISGGQSYFYYRPSGSPGTNFRTIPWGTTGDKPVVGDFDGDGKQDAAVFRPSTATWYILRSSDGQNRQYAFGIAGDIPTPADFDGDGVTNIAVYRPSNGTWYTSFDPQTNYGAIYFGTAGDVPAAADYDGDGKTDAAVFRPSTGIWYFLRSTQGFTAVQFGLAGDKPIPNAFIP